MLCCSLPPIRWSALITSPTLAKFRLVWRRVFDVVLLPAPEPCFSVRFVFFLRFPFFHLVCLIFKFKYIYFTLYCLPGMVFGLVCFLSLFSLSAYLGYWRVYVVLEVPGAMA